MPNCNEKIFLENDWILAEILPWDGGRISRIYDKKHDCELIWSNPRTKNVSRYYGCNYDDLSASGIEEAFPTVQPCKAGGADVPFFGEIWTIPWEYKKHEEGYIFTCSSPIWTAEIRKKVFLFENSLSMTYEIRNTGKEMFEFLFGFHPSLCIYESSRLYAPGGIYEMYVAGQLEEGKTEQFTWPYYGERDMSDACAKENTGFFNFLTFPVADGCYGVEHPSKETGLKIEFDRRFFKCLSLWPIYGGWRGHTCVMTEAFTTWPASLDKAIEEDRAYRLKPSECAETTVNYTVGMENRKGALCGNM